MNEVGRILIIGGLLLAAIGTIVYFLPSNMQLPRLPGDIYIKRDNFTFYFPWVTTLLISLVLTIILNFINRR